MRDTVRDRFTELMSQGDALVKRLPRDEFGIQDVIGTRDMPDYQAWLSSASNLIRSVAPVDSHFTEECKRLATHEDLKYAVTSYIFQKMYGLLKSAQAEWDHGLLSKIEYVVAAATFDDFLDHAATYHKAGKKQESSVLASAVLEDSIKKIAHKNSVPADGVSLEPLVDALVKASVLTPVKAKRVKSWAGVRNHALHADWDKFDIKDVGNMIEGLREVVEEFL